MSISTFLVFLYFSKKTCKKVLREMCILVLHITLSIKYFAFAIDPFLGPCHRSLLGVVCDVINDAAAEEEEAIGWMFPSSGGRASEALAFAVAFTFAYQSAMWVHSKAAQGIISNTFLNNK